MRFLLLLFFALSQTTFGAHVPLCNGLSFNFSVVNQGDNTTVYTYASEISLAPGDNIHTILTTGNPTIWSANNSLYYQYAPIQYQDMEQGIVKCPTINGTCIMNIFDGNGFYQIPLMLNNQTLNADVTVFIDFDQGTLYNSYGGWLFNPKIINCSSDESMVIIGPAYNIFFHYCCSNYFYVDVPDEEKMCVEFQGNTTLLDKFGNVLSSVIADYQITPEVINFNATSIYTSPDITYTLNPNGGTAGQGCTGNSTSPCSWFLTLYNTSKYDYHMQMIMYFIQNEQTIIGTTIGGKLSKRGNVIVRDQNKPFTEADPCWNGNFIASQNLTTAKNTFCCTKFHKPPTGTSCAEYQSETQVFNGQDFSWSGLPWLRMRYQFNNTGFVVSFLNYTNNVPSNVQFESYSSDTFSQICKANTTFPTNKCLFELSNTGLYDFKFRTSDMKDGFGMINIFETQSHIFDPNLIPTNPCVTKQIYNDAKTFIAETEFCCIEEVGGPWPGFNEPKLKKVFI